VIFSVAIFSSGAAFLLLHSVFSVMEERKIRRNLGIGLGGEIPSSLFHRGLVFLERFFRDKEKIVKPLPDFLDLLALGLSAGLNLERSWEGALVYLSPGILKKELSLVMNEIQLGQTREEAIQGLIRRLNDPSLSMIFVLMLQSLRRGTSLQEILFDQAQSLRTRRMLSIEKRAHTASVRLLFPILLFIFPTIFIVMFAPLALRFFAGEGIF
jgi:tight adherence protein C